ncbi:hypothetical protein [Cellulomonas sp.]|uniref:hypothetical protein n=1 Tax=Cellulomonas sp. TaxID=40001 RepID=UPI003BABAE3C
MRAGPYAEVDGIVYPAVDVHGPEVRLLAFGDEQPRPDVERDRWNEWSRLVDRSAASRLFWVQTTATWLSWTVTVDRVVGDRATFSYYGDDLPLDDPAVSRIGLLEWQGTVPVDDLSDVVEIATDVPL